MLRVAIIHYHLRPGGVTRVIQNATAALEGREFQLVVFAGEPPSESMPVPHAVVIDGLGYYDPSGSQRTPDDILTELLTVARQTLGGLPDVWHIHNHGLGKNSVLPEVVFRLAQQGHHLLLQPHDFAEDGRPDMYRFLCRHLVSDAPEHLGGRLYPQSSHIHYALLNQRDLGFLKAAGIQDDRLHHLPNAVSTEEAADSEPIPSPSSESPLYLYPVRAIRRKNIGEFLLWSAIAEAGERFGITRAPQNPFMRPVYDDWVTFASECGLPVKFGMGEDWQGTFSELIESATAFVTTSVAEGFGLAFLEPWLVNRPLIGRKLPEITYEFEELGVNFSTFYERLEVPVEWIGGREPLEHVMQTALKAVYAAYNRILCPDDVERAMNAALVEGYVDFGRLNETFQKMVIRRLLDDSTAKDDLTPSRLLPTEQYDAGIVRQNRRIVREAYNLDRYAERLMSLYQTVADAETDSLSEINAAVLLDQFLAPERFCLLRT